MIKQQCATQRYIFSQLQIVRGLKRILLEDILNQFMFGAVPDVIMHPKKKRTKVRVQENNAIVIILSKTTKVLMHMQFKFSFHNLLYRVLKTISKTLYKTLDKLHMLQISFFYTDRNFANAFYVLLPVKMNFKLDVRIV